MDKVVLFAVNRDGKAEITHACRQLPDGTWSSKLGSLPLIRHLKPDDVAGPTYGAPVRGVRARQGEVTGGRHSARSRARSSRSRTAVVGSTSADGAAPSPISSGRSSGSAARQAVAAADQVGVERDHVEQGAEAELLLDQPPDGPALRPDSFGSKNSSHGS